MKKLWVIIASGVVVLALGGVIYMMGKPANVGQVGTNNDTVKTGKDAADGGTKTACELFTSTIAKKVLGEKAEKSDAIASDNQSSTENIIVSNCGYDAGKTIANVLVRGAKNEQAYSTNIYGFDSTETQGIGQDDKVKSITISNLADKAYYNPAFKQVNVLVENGKYWIIVQAGQEQALAEQLARAVVAQLLNE